MSIIYGCYVLQWRLPSKAQTQPEVPPSPDHNGNHLKAIVGRLGKGRVKTELNSRIGSHIQLFLS
jgi:hypothetical protein